MEMSKKVLAILLTIATLIGIFSCATTVFAQDFNEYTDKKAYQEKILSETVENEQDKAEIVCEVPEKRDEFSKTYKRADGSFTSVVSPTPVHKLENGEWKEIDNTLEKENKAITNVDGVFEIEFPETLGDEEKITVTNKEETISFSIKEIDDSEATVKTSETNVNDVLTQDFEKTTSQITYENVNENTDLQYIVSSNSVKENIIVKDKESLKETYTFAIEKGELSANLDNENNLTFKNSNGEIAFTIPAPVMSDAVGAVSYEIEVSVKNGDTSVLTLTYKPSEEWLNSKDRVFPIIIDPVIVLPDFDDTIIEDTVIVKGIGEGVEDQNYSNAIEGCIANNGTAHAEVLVKLNDNFIEGFKSSNVTVTDVNYYGMGYIMGGNILVKPINGIWNSKTITYNDVYSDDGDIIDLSYDNTVIDYYTGTTFTNQPQTTTVNFNITDLFNEWLTGERRNDGFALLAENEETEGVVVLAGDYTPGSTSFEMNTFCSIDYVDTSCSNDSFEYLTQEIGRAGLASVNTFSRSLSATRNDISMNGLRMPVSVGFNYNPAITTILNLYDTVWELTGEEFENDLLYGQNWCPSYLQFIFAIVEGQFQFFTQEGTIVTFNKKTETITDDENQTTTEEIVFEADETSDGGYTLELIKQGEGDSIENLKVTNPNGESLYFNDMGLVSEIHESEANSDGSYDKISITFDEENPFKIDYITDGIGRKYDFVYDSQTGLLSEIKCLTADGSPIKSGTTNVDLKTTYSYDNNGNLTSVTYPDGESVTYSYDNKGNIVKAQNIDGYNIQYTYDTLGKVTNIAEYAGSSMGNSIVLTQLSNRQVKVADNFTGTEIYQFGKDGKLHYTFDEKGNYLKSDYAPANDENVYSSNDWKISSQNLLKNGGFEEVQSGKAVYWSNSFNVEDIEISENVSDYACRVSALEVSSDTQKQTVAVDGGNSYTFSLYAKNVSAEAAQTEKLYISISAKDADGSKTTQSRCFNLTDEFEQYSITVDKEAEITSVTVEFGFDETAGDFYVNNAQLEEGKGTAPFNYIKNGSFNNSDDSWASATIVDETLNSKPVKAVKLSSGLPSYDGTELEDNISATTQNVKINGKKGQIYSIGGWFKGVFDDNYIYKNVPTQYAELAEQLTSSSAQIKVTYSYTDTVIETAEDGTTTTTEQTLTENFAVDFAPHNHDWQYAIDSFALKGDTESVDVTIIAKNIPEDSFATGIELALDNNAFSFFETDDTTEQTPEEPESKNTETGNTTPTECPCEDCEELDCPCRCTDTCTCIQCKRQSDIEETSEDGKTVTTSSFDGEKYMQSAITYSNDLNNIIAETDENNISSGYAYNENGSLTSFTDGAGNSTTYQSNAMGYLTLAQSNVSGLTDNAVKMAISYIYDGDLLTRVNQSNVEYSYEYDKWGQLKTVLVDGVPLVCYNYNEEEKALRTRLESVLFGDTPELDFAIEYGYDSDGNIITVEKHQKIDGIKDSITYTYGYDNLGNLTSITDNGTGHFLDYTDDGIVIKDGENGPVIYETKDVTLEPEAEEEEITEGEGVNNEVTDNETPEIVSITQETANGTSYNHKIYESSYSKETGKSTENEAVSVVISQDENNNFTYGKTIGTQTLSDWFGRNEAVSVMTKDPVDTTSDFASIYSQYSYVTNENVTTNLISSVTNTITGEEENNVNYTYTYDSNGRIINTASVSSVPNLSGSSQYVYDEAGQLIREITGSEAYEYAYDSKGNISTRKHYSNGTLTSTDTFTYASDTWEDRLTGYNNKDITYDEIGNPIEYLDAELTWRGRELVGYSKGNKQISYSYDVDGMRYRKVVTENNKTKTYDYVYSDGTLILLTYTENGVHNTARFVYDSWGEPRGFMLNDSATYLYLKNAQGDITGIVDENGAVLLTYSYTAWGEVSFTATNMQNLILAGTLSNVNPFTYRGYCYDYDIGMYYLQSRYYDPEICRFINADSTDYLGATGTLLSYNLFAYCENDGVNFVDETGCAPFDLYKSANQAAKNFATNYYNVSIYVRMEISSIIYGIIKKKKTYYSYTPYIIGEPHSCSPFEGIEWLPQNSFIIGIIHTHPNSNDFSDDDKKASKKNNIVCYVVTPNRKLRVYHDTRRGWKNQVVYSSLSYKKLSRDLSARLRYQYQSVWDRHIKTKCGFNCKKMRWPGVQL